MFRSSLCSTLRHWQNPNTLYASSILRKLCTKSQIEITNIQSENHVINDVKGTKKSSEFKIETISTDYLIIGAGAMGMAFADEVINMSPGTGNDDTDIVIVDKRAFPGGHWNDAYDFVRLHQPSYAYGVSSMVLGTGDDDLCSKPQILDHFEKAMQKMVATGRVRFLAQCEYDGDGKIRSILDEDLHYEVIVRRKTVDASYLNAGVPSTHPPKYIVANEVSLVPINGLTRTSQSYQKFVIIGAGKTGIDAILYLLDRNVDPNKIIWIMPNDSWLWNRKYLMKKNLPSLIEVQTDAIHESENVKDFLLRMEKLKVFLRLNSNSWPTKFKCATVNEEEFDKLQLIKNVVRQGRVSSIEANQMIFEDGSTYETCGEYLHVDCTTDGLTYRPTCPIFQGNKIILQSVMLCQQVFSASAIGSLEVRNRESDERKNEILAPVPHPLHIADFFDISEVGAMNGERLIKEGPGFRWSRNNRLGFTSHIPISFMVKLGYRNITKDPKPALKKLNEEIKVKGRKLFKD